MIVKSIILAVSKNGNFVILSVMIGKRETCEIVLISQEMKNMIIIRLSCRSG